MIRAATAADLPAVHALVERAYRGESAAAGWTHEADLLGGQRTDLAELTAMHADPGQRLLVAATDDGAMIGFVAVRRIAPDLAYLGMLTVEPRLQAAGLGRRLIAAAEDAARALGATRMEMTVIARRRELVAWYERRGYALTSERRPFPLDDPRVGSPKVRDLDFVVLAKPL